MPFTSRILPSMVAAGKIEETTSGGGANNTMYTWSSICGYQFKRDAVVTRDRLTEMVVAVPVRTDKAIALSE